MPHIPEDPKSAGDAILPFLKAQNSKTGVARALTSLTEKVKADERVVLAVALLCQDHNNFYAGNFARVYVFQHDSKGFFSGLAVADLLGTTKKHQEA